MLSNSIALSNNVLSDASQLFFTIRHSYLLIFKLDLFILNKFIKFLFLFKSIQFILDLTHF